MTGKREEVAGLSFGKGTGGFVSFKRGTTSSENTR